MRLFALLVIAGLLAPSAAISQPVWDSRLVERPSDRLVEGYFLLAAGCQQEAEKVLEETFPPLGVTCTSPPISAREARRLVDLGAVASAVLWCDDQPNDATAWKVAVRARYELDSSGKAWSGQQGDFAAQLFGMAMSWISPLASKNGAACTSEQKAVAEADIQAWIARDVNVGH